MGSLALGEGLHEAGVEGGGFHKVLDFRLLVGRVASAVYAGALLKKAGLPENVTLYVTGTVQEEDCDGMCWDYIVKEDKLKPDVVVITEPTSLRIYRGHRGRMEMEVSTTGVSCHGSAPERGVNAVYKMAPIIANARSSTALPSTR